MCLIVFCNAVFSQSTSKICTLIRFTLFSNASTASFALASVLYYLIDLHYSQTAMAARLGVLEFYYLIDLHYSQTAFRWQRVNYMFYYLIDLHYSQTPILEVTLPRLFYYLIDLHYSQTLRDGTHPIYSFTTL